MSRDAFLSHLSPITSFFDSQTWNAELQNERRLQVMQQSSQTKIRKGFTLIIDDSGHRVVNQLPELADNISDKLAKRITG